uniref:Uncharacterized protein n=1 Tax=Myoviridae sp. ctijX18 TaxID=2825154 RepID=A0A8S5USC8_9CAUD|nr:MAG TPA: hypothetical protein [Myoviridae sp. ctijX18]DAQ61102.1 MAG TPA: hypothetical protein [Caudoviricetes sp.]
MYNNKNVFYNNRIYSLLLEKKCIISSIYYSFHPYTLPLGE